jgi:hypothetical protein
MRFLSVDKVALFFDEISDSQFDLSHINDCHITDSILQPGSPGSHFVSSSHEALLDPMLIYLHIPPTLPLYAPTELTPVPNLSLEMTQL